MFALGFNLRFLGHNLPVTSQLLSTGQCLLLLSNCWLVSGFFDADDLRSN